MGRVKVIEEGQQTRREPVFLPVWKRLVYERSDDSTSIERQDHVQEERTAEAGQEYEVAEGWRTKYAMPHISVSPARQKRGLNNTSGRQEPPRNGWNSRAHPPAIKLPPCISHNHKIHTDTPNTPLSPPTPPSSPTHHHHHHRRVFPSVLELGAARGEHRFLVRGDLCYG